MNWKIACFVALVMWSVYGFFGERAGKVHGEKINLLFETLAFIILALVAIVSGIGDFKRVTTVMSTYIWRFFQNRDILAYVYKHANDN
jgi:drug/metabolite transporter (DMT)-like permease